MNSEFESEEDPFSGTQTDTDSDYRQSENDSYIEERESSSESHNEVPNLQTSRGKKRIRNIFEEIVFCLSWKLEYL